MRCSLAVVGLLALTVVFAGCGSDSGQAQKPVAVVAPPNPDSDLGPDSDSLSVDMENGSEDSGPEKDPVARPSLLMEFMAKPLREAMEPGSGEATEKEEVEVEAVEVKEEASEESPGEGKPEAEEKSDETKSDDDAKSDESPKEEEKSADESPKEEEKPADESPKEEEKPSDESPDDEKPSAEESPEEETPADDAAADESPSEDEPESDAASDEGTEKPSAGAGEDDGADASGESDAG